MSRTPRASSLLSTVITACVWSLSLCALDIFYDEKVSSLGDTVSLGCNNSAQYSTAPHDAVPVGWMLPDLTVLHHGDHGRFQLENNNWTLKIVNVSRDDLGTYHCLLSVGGDDWFVLRLGLNAGGPYFDDLWNKYRFNTVGALSASFGFLLISVSIYLVYHFRHQPPEDDEHDRSTVGELADGGRRAAVVGEVSWKRRASPPGGESSTSSDEQMSYVVQSYPVNVCSTRL